MHREDRADIRKFAAHLIYRLLLQALEALTCFNCRFRQAPPDTLLCLLAFAAMVAVASYLCGDCFGVLYTLAGAWFLRWKGIIIQEK